MGTFGSKHHVGTFGSKLLGQIQHFYQRLIVKLTPMIVFDEKNKILGKLSTALQRKVNEF